MVLKFVRFHKIIFLFIFHCYFIKLFVFGAYLEYYAINTLLRIVYLIFPLISNCDTNFQIIELASISIFPKVPGQSCPPFIIL